MRHETTGINAEKPSVEKALQWFFGTVLKRSSSRTWRNANILFFAKEPGCQNYVASVRSTGTVDRSTSTHWALPFELLESIVCAIPQHCTIGTSVVESKMLPQGSGISVPASILKAAFERDTKFSSTTIPFAVRDMMMKYTCIYVDDSLT
eukprot:SAG11_NODE_3534_length_2386_cov_3.060778_3_plen_150_part_00